MTSSVCSLTSEGYEKQLKDTRDQQYYWVGKMKDGKCWMLQNLALDLTTTGLKAADTNIASDWNSSSQYKPTKTLTSVTSGGASNTVVQSWNLGKWVLNSPTDTTNCGTIQTFDECTNRFTNVASSSSYDAHYLVGNYYSWNAATAGTGGTMTSGEAGGSICPKGWGLPTSNTTATGSFAGLLSKYGVSSSLSGTVNGTTYNIAGAPLRFVRGGAVAPGYYLDDAGRYGYYWSSTPGSTSDGAYYLYFNVSSVYPSTTNSRYFGLSVRCIAE